MAVRKSKQTVILFQQKDDFQASISKSKKQAQKLLLNSLSQGWDIDDDLNSALFAIMYV